MKVLTLSRRTLTEYSHQLLSSVQNDDFKMDMVIGVATGGIYISKPIYAQLQTEQWQGKYHEVKLSRPSTHKKEALGVKKILTKLPYFLSNILRVLEVKYFEVSKSQHYDANIEKRVRFSDAVTQDIKKSSSLLLVDDAIDTGSTLLALKNVIQSLNPNIEIKLAVLTVTHHKPYIAPDYTLYKNVLLRCPWAMDYKGEDKID